MNRCAAGAFFGCLPLDLELSCKLLNSYDFIVSEINYKYINRAASELYKVEVDTKYRGNRYKIEVILMFR